MGLFRSRNSDSAAEKLVSILRAHAELVAAHASLDDSLTQLVIGACELAHVPLERGQIRVVDPVSGAIQQDVQANHASSRLRDVVTAKQGITGRAITTHKVQLVDDVLKDRDYVVAYQGVKSELVIPLLQVDTCYGAMNLESSEKKQFSKEIVPLLEALAQQAVLTIQYDTLRRQQISSQTAQDKTLRAKFEELVRGALAALPNTGATVEVQLLSQDGGELTTIASKSDGSQQVIPGSFGKGSTLAWQTVLDNMTVRKTNLDLDDARTSLSTTFAALVMPLHGYDGAVRGVLNVEAPEQSRLNNVHELTQAEALLAPFREHAEAILRSVDDALLQPSLLFNDVLAEIEDAIEKLAPSTDLDVFYGQVARLAAQMIGGQHVQAAILLVERNRLTGEDWLVLTPLRTYRYEQAVSRGESWPITKGLTGYTARTGNSVRERDVRNIDDPNLKELYRDILSAARSELDVPILRSGRALGVLNINSTEVGAFTEEHQEKVELLAKRVSGALERVEQLRQGAIATEHLKLIRQTNDAIEQMLGNAKAQEKNSLTHIREHRTQILGDLLESARDYSGASFGATLLAIEVPYGPSRRQDSTGADVVREFISLTTRPVTDVEIPLEGGLAQALYEQVARGDAEQRVVIEDLRDPKIGKPPVTLTAGARSALALPINNGTGVIGVLSLEADTPLTYSPEQLEWLELLASQMANVISTANLHLYRLQQQTLIKLELDLVGSSAGISSEPLDLEMQRLVLATALQLTEQQDGHAEIWFTRGSSVQLSSYMEDGEFHYGPEYTKELNTAGIVALAHRTRRPILALDVTWDMWAKTYKKNSDLTQSELTVPLLDSSIVDPETGLGRVIGILNVESRQTMGFGNRDVDILELMAQNVVMAIKNRESYRAKMDLLRDVTHALQKALFPLRLPVSELLDRTNNPLTASETLSQQREAIEEIAELADMASNLLVWFQWLIISEQRPKTVSKQPTDLTELVATMTKRMLPWATRANKGISCEIPAHVVTALCSEDLIQGALFLLIDNALRYSPKGDSIIVRLSERPDRNARIEVIDNGEPLSEDERTAIFARGVQGKAGLAASDQPTQGGLGLDHVRRIAEDLHDGIAGYERENNKNVFFIQLPAIETVSVS